MPADAGVSLSVVDFIPVLLGSSLRFQGKAANILIEAEAVLSKDCPLVVDLVFRFAGRRSRDSSAGQSYAGINRLIKTGYVSETTPRDQTVDVLYSSEDQLEGARAFAEKRKPQWKGR